MKITFQFEDEESAKKFRALIKQIMPDRLSTTYSYDATINVDGFDKNFLRLWLDSIKNMGLNLKVILVNDRLIWEESEYRPDELINLIHDVQKELDDERKFRQQDKEYYEKHLLKKEEEIEALRKEKEMEIKKKDEKIETLKTELDAVNKQLKQVEDIYFNLGSILGLDHEDP